MTDIPSGVQGSLPEIVQNKKNLYEGDLTRYFCSAFYYARNMNNPYHNFRHMFHVVWLCYQAGIFYSLAPRPFRNLLIAAIFHDFDHTGLMGNDDVNIALAIRGLEKHILPEDRPHFAEIAGLVRSTEYPYKQYSEGVELLAQILRDADLAQALTPVWIQQVVFGLAAEGRLTPAEVLKQQKPFLSGLKLSTEWGRTLFPQEAIDAKVAEAEELLGILESCSTYPA